MEGDKKRYSLESYIAAILLVFLTVLLSLRVFA